MDINFEAGSGNGTFIGDLFRISADSMAQYHTQLLEIISAINRGDDRKLSWIITDGRLRIKVMEVAGDDTSAVLYEYDGIIIAFNKLAFVQSLNQLKYHLDSIEFGRQGGCEIIPTDSLESLEDKDFDAETLLL